MKETKSSFQCCCLVLMLSAFTLAGCANVDQSLAENPSAEQYASKSAGRREEASADQKLIEETANEFLEEATEPVITEMDWSDSFEGIHGAAVIYTPTDRSFQIYNRELAFARRSPCSTFKIISSFIALKHGIIEPGNSARTWSGEVFWNETWNQDMDFYNAFQNSCVWYFREVVDEIGRDLMQEELRNLPYGNCDISDWGGQRNTNNHNPALTGFWIESSLLISPKEQTEVLARIFGDNTVCSEEIQEQLKQVMLLSETSGPNLSICGKTGMGKDQGVVVDAWFTGFADAAGKRRYVCVYLGETEDQTVSSTKAREIAIKIISDSLQGSDP